MRKCVPPPKVVPPPLRLAAVQGMMARAVMSPMAPRQRMEREHTAVASAIIKPNTRLSSLSRLEIYHQQYWWRLQGAFMDDFPGLHAILGVRRFNRVMDAYLASRGSTSWNLRDLGQHLEAFLREHPELSSPHEALALDMARVEWAKVVAFDGAERPRFDTGQLANTEPDRLRIGLQPFLTLLEVSYPIDRILSRLKQGKIRPRLTSPSRDAIYLAVHRQDFAVYHKRLEPGEYHLLTALQAGLTLGAACAKALERLEYTPSEFGGKIQAWFAGWTQLGWLCDRG